MKNKLTFHFDLTYRANKKDVLVSYCPLSADTIYSETYLEIFNDSANERPFYVSSCYQAHFVTLDDVIEKDVLVAEVIKEGNVPIGWYEHIDDIKLESLKGVTAKQIATEVNGQLTEHAFLYFKKVHHVEEQPVNITVTWDENGKITTKSEVYYLETVAD